MQALSSQQPGWQLHRRSNDAGGLHSRIRSQQCHSTPRRASRPRVAEVKAGRKAAAATAASQAASAISQLPAALPPLIAYSVMAGAGYTAAIFAAMILAPRAAAVQNMMRPLWVFIPLALTYMALLACSWAPDTISLLLPGSITDGLQGGFSPQFFPKLEGIQALFSRPATAASLVLHILPINLFLGRQIYFDGLQTGVPTGLSLIAALFLGPLGLILHWLTKGVVGMIRGSGNKAFAPDPMVRPSRGGHITLLPYD